MTIAPTSPVSSSRIKVEAGNPRALISSGAEAFGTETTFMAVPKGVIREGMKSAVWLIVGTLSRWGRTIPDEDESEDVGFVGDSDVDWER